MDFLSAIESKPLAEIQDIFLQKGLPFDFNWFDYDALNRALICKRKDVAKWLIKISCRVNKISDSNESLVDNTPLHNAVKLGDIEIIEMLLKNRASIVALDFDDNSPLHLAFLYHYDKITDLQLNYIVGISNYTNVKNNQGISHLHIASARNNVKAIEGFIGAKVDVGDTVRADIPSSWAGYTPLHFAVEFKSLDAAKLLLAAGSKMKDDESSNTRHSPVQLLHQYQDEYMIMSDHLDKNAIPNLHIACLKESASTVKKFIDADADVNESIECSAFLYNHYSPLHFAIESPYEREEKIKILLSHGATVEGKYLLKPNYTTALHLAFYKEYHMREVDGTIVDCVYKAIQDKNYNIVDENELNFFHIAVTRNDFDLVKLYLSNGAKVNQAVLQNNRGFSGYTALHFSLEYRLVDMAKFLLEQGADVNVRDGENQSPLFKAFELRDISLIELLFESGARLDNDPKSTAGALNNTLLHCAAIVGSHKVVRHLVESGSEIDALNDLGQTPLLASLETDSPCRKVVEILLDAGADGVGTAYDGDSPCHDIINSSQWLNEDAERFLIYKKFIEKARNLSYFYLLREGNKKDIQKLLSTGVDLTKRDDDGTSFIHMIAENPNPGVIEQLRGQSLDINFRDDTGSTPLIYAACAGNVKGIEFLLDEGADIEATDNYGQTALHFAYYEYATHKKSKIHEKVVQVLLERGANVQSQSMVRLILIAHDCSAKGKFELAFAHLALQEANGTDIIQPIRSSIDSSDEFKSYFENCKQQLSVKVYQSLRLLDVLTANERKLERYLRNEELASKLMGLQTKIDYFNVFLSNRLSKPNAMVELRKSAAQVICKLMKMHYNRFPGIADEIVSYLGKRDLENFILI